MYITCIVLFILNRSFLHGKCFCCLLMGDDGRIRLSVRVDNLHLYTLVVDTNDSRTLLALLSVLLDIDLIAHME